MKRPIWFQAQVGQALRGIDDREHHATVLAVGKRLRRSCFEGDRAITVRDNREEEYISITSCWAPVKQLAGNP